ncbi:MAG: PhoU domain-containing protein [Candidatus Bathyarchaeia archaeon]
MPKFERIEYKPIPVRELLLEMKNLSELMIDLAYSSALYNDKDLAEDVLALESRVDTFGNGNNGCFKKPKGSRGNGGDFQSSFRYR